MKKPMNSNLILAFIFSIVLVLVVWVFYVIVKITGAEFEMNFSVSASPDDFDRVMRQAKQDLKLQMQNLCLGVLKGAGKLSLQFLLVALLAWLIYRKNPEGVLIYRLIMSVHYLLQLIGICIILAMFICSFEVSIVLAIIYLPISILSVILFLYSARNTYTERILDIA